MSDLISRQAAIDAMAELQGRASSKAELKGISKAWKMIKQLPPAQPELKRGRWIYKTDLVTAPTGYWECSECKEGRLLYEENFCPHCGADMREVTDGNHN